MLDLVVVAMCVVLVTLAASIVLARCHHRYEVHKRIQLVLAAVLLIAITAFEIDMRFYTVDWQRLALASPFYDGGLVHTALGIHLGFAIPTPLLWIFVIVQALRRFPRPAQPGEHSRTHVFYARLAAIGMLMTSITGWVFYYLAFVA
jgi:hypothetical protein